MIARGRPSPFREAILTVEAQAVALFAGGAHGAYEKGFAAGITWTLRLLVVCARRVGQ